MQLQDEVFHNKTYCGSDGKPHKFVGHLSPCTFDLEMTHHRSWSWTEPLVTTHYFGLSQIMMGKEEEEAGITTRGRNGRGKFTMQIFIVQLKASVGNVWRNFALLPYHPKDRVDRENIEHI